jgi:beta-glucosidase
LSYTTFTYSNLRIPSSVRTGEHIALAVDVTNSGKRDGEEVVQLYVTDLEASAPVPIRSLQGFQRVQLKAGEKKTVSFTLSPRQISLIDAESRRVVEPGSFELSVGGKQPGSTGTADASTTGVVSGQFQVIGAKLQIDEKVY